jgi:hypothetical protein
VGCRDVPIHTRDVNLGAAETSCTAFLGLSRKLAARFPHRVLLWAYLHAMQYIVIWSANIPDEVTWYLERSTNGWQYLLIVLTVGQLIVPFFALLNARLRADRGWLAALCTTTLAMRCCEAAILIVPPLPHARPIMMVFILPAALVFVGGTLWWAFAAALENRGRIVYPSVRSAHGEAG